MTLHFGVTIIQNAKIGAIFFYISRDIYKKNYKAVNWKYININTGSKKIHITGEKFRIEHKKLNTSENCTT